MASSCWLSIPCRHLSGRGVQFLESFLRTFPASQCPVTETQTIPEVSNAKPEPRRLQRTVIFLNPTENRGQVAQLARERCREFLWSGTSFAFNATNTLKQTRGRWPDLFCDYHARIEIVYIEPLFGTILRPNKARSMAVPESVIRKLADKCEPPTWTECHGLLKSHGDSCN